MVREAIKRGEQAITDEAKANGKAHQNAKSSETPCLFLLHNMTLFHICKIGTRKII